MGADPIRHRQGRADPGQHQSGLSRHRAGIRAQQSRLQGAHSRRAFQDLGLCRHAARAGAGARPRYARQTRNGAAAGAALGGAARRQLASRHVQVLRDSFPRRRRGSQAHRRACADPAIRRADQYPVHLGHHRLPQGRDAVASQHPQQRLFHRRGDAADAGRPALHPGAALSLLRHGVGQSRRGDPRRLHGVSRRGFRSAGDAGNGRRGTLHRAARRADHVHRRSSIIRNSTASISPRCAPASWPARRARSR